MSKQDRLRMSQVHDLLMFPVFGLRSEKLPDTNLTYPGNNPSPPTTIMIYFTVYHGNP